MDKSEWKLVACILTALLAAALWGNVETSRILNRCMESWGKPGHEFSDDAKATQIHNKPDHRANNGGDD
jgi:hypothetical protein